MMHSTYLEAAGEGGPTSEAGDAQVHGDYPWIGGIDTAAMPYPGLDMSPYAAASPTPLHSPETPVIDQPLFPAPMGDLSYLDRPYGDFFPAGYPVGGGPQGLFPFRMGPPDRYDIITSAPAAAAAALYGTWPAQASPTSFLPTPPTAADDLSQDSAPSENGEEADDGAASSDEPPKRKRSSAGSKPKKRPRTQLRTASRAAKKRPNILPQRPSETVEDVKARAAHNQVEQQYRKRLNLHFERLLSVLPAPGVVGGGGRRDGIGDRRVSKAEVLDLATERIQVLEREMGRLQRERRELRVRLGGCVM